MDGLTTTEQVQKNLINKKYSVTELANYYLNRIDKFDENLNSFLAVDEDRVYKRTKDLDNLIDQGEKILDDMPLFGVFIAAKDLYATKGLRTTAASKVLENYIPQYSASAIKYLEQAGAVIIGKTNCDAWAHGASGENSDFGATKNPWNTKFVPGGSSSGSAVSVAADFSIAAMGTDTGGSIRQPASFTNTVGFKPTYGAVSRYGVIAMASSLDTMGHFTKNAQDSRKIFETTKTQDNKDASQVKNIKFKPKKEKYKIGVPREYSQDIDKNVSKVIDRARAAIKDKNIEFKEISLPHTKYAISAYYIIQTAEVSSNLSRYDGVRYGKSRESFGEEAKRRIMLGTYVLSEGYYDAYYLKAMGVRTKIIEDFTKSFKDIDVIFAPVSPTPPFKLGEKVTDPLSMYLADIYTVSANLAGIPAISVPAGFVNGLPVGFQLMGPQFGEYMLFDIAERYQKKVDYHDKKPYLK